MRTVYLGTSEFAAAVLGRDAGSVVAHQAPQVAVVAPQPQPAVAAAVAHRVDRHLVHRQDELRLVHVGEATLRGLRGHGHAQFREGREVELAVEQRPARAGR